MEGEWSGKIRSTPTPAEIFRTVNVSLTPPPRRPMHTPSNAWSRSLSPSRTRTMTRQRAAPGVRGCVRSEEHTSELQSRRDLVCRLLLEKKKKRRTHYPHDRNLPSEH